MSTSTETKAEIEQVREILLGGIHRDLERKLVRAEAHLSARLGEFHQEARRRTDVIEAHLRKEVEALAARVEGELIELREGLRALTRDHREANSAMEQRITKQEESLAKAQHELRNAILEQAKSFLDELQQTRAELTETLERELGSFELEPEEPRHREHEAESAAR